MAKHSLQVTPAFRAFVLDQLTELGEVEPRAMFGGVGLYRRGVFFAILANDVLYFKVDDKTRPAYEAAGSRRPVRSGLRSGSTRGSDCPPRPRGSGYRRPW